MKAIKTSSWQVGFSLIELSIVLTIIGIIASVGAPFLTRYHEKKCHEITKEHIKRIQLNLEAYYCLHEKFPPPQQPSCEDFEKASSMNQIGIVPYKILNLPLEVIKDGFGHYITYVVQSKSISGIQGGTTTIPTEEIQILNEGDISVLKSPSEENKNNPIKNEIVYVLIAHGPGGNGAFKKQGYERIQTLPSVPAEEKNVQDNLIFHDLPYSTNPKNLFRHKVIWKTLHEIQQIRYQMRFTEWLMTKDKELVLAKFIEELSHEFKNKTKLEEEKNPLGKGESDPPLPELQQPLKQPPPYRLPKKKRALKKTVDGLED